MPPESHFDPEHVDFSRVIADQEAIAKLNPQRYEFAQLTGILLVDEEKTLCVGYKDVRGDEFWVRGHLPEFALLPGVLMCEAAAQLCSFYTKTVGGETGDFMGFGGMDNVRFRQPVLPGDRLVLVSKCIKYHRRQSIFNVQGFVGPTMVFNADIIGVPMTYPEDTPTPSTGS